MSSAGVEDYELIRYEPTLLDRILGWLMNPFAQGLFVMLIVGGIYFELQSPGIGFPLVVAVLGAVLYFSPLYLEGMVQNWELILFVIGVLLIGVEIFVLPGFGVAGVLGIVSVVVGLTFAALDREVFRHVVTGEMSAGRVLQPFLVVVVGMTVAFVASLWLGKRFLSGNSVLRNRIVLTTDLTPQEGCVGHRFPEERLIGRTGVATTVLRPVREKFRSTVPTTMPLLKMELSSIGEPKLSLPVWSMARSIANPSTVGHKPVGKTTARCEKNG